MIRRSVIIEVAVALGWQLVCL